MALRTFRSAAASVGLVIGLLGCAPAESTLYEPNFEHAVTRIHGATPSETHGTHAESLVKDEASATPRNNAAKPPRFRTSWLLAGKATANSTSNSTVPDAEARATPQATSTAQALASKDPNFWEPKGKRWREADIDVYRALGQEGLDLALMDLRASKIDVALAESGKTTVAIPRLAWGALKLSSAERKRLDAIGGALESSTNGLFWYRDIDKALQTSKKLDMPLLSLRVLGGLDDALC